MTGTLFFGLRLLAIVSVCVGCADIGTPVQSRREDKESILRAAQFIRAGLESNLREWIEVELPFRPQAEADSNVQYVTASRVLAIAQSSQTSPDEKREIELFLQNSLLELDAGLYELQRVELLQLYLFPGETEERLVRMNRNTTPDPWEISTRIRWDKLATYARAQSLAKQRGLPSLNELKKRLGDLDKAVALKVPVLTLPQARFCEALGLGPVSRVPSHLRPGTKVELEWRTKCFDHSAMVGAREMTFGRNQIELMSGPDVVARVDSALYKAESRRLSPTDVARDEADRLADLLQRLIKTLPAHEQAKVAKAKLVIAADAFDPKITVNTPRTLGMVTMNDWTIQVSATLVRAGFASCANLAYLVSMMHASLEGRNRGSDPFEGFDTQARQAKESQRSAAPAPTVLASRPPLITPNARNVQLDELQSFIHDYSKCIENTFAFGLAHELAHMYKGQDQGSYATLFLDELACDCAAYRHLASFGLNPLNDTLFEGTLAAAIEQGHRDYLRSDFNASDFRRRIDVVKNGGC